MSLQQQFQSELTELQHQQRKNRRFEPDAIKFEKRKNSDKRSWFLKRRGSGWKID